MAWGSVAGAAISTFGGGLLGGKSKESKSQKKLNKAQAALIYKQIEAADFANMVARDDWDLWKTEVLPKVRELDDYINPAGSEEQAISEAAGDTRSQYAVGRENLKRDLELSRGPADPIYGQSLATFDSVESADVARAINAARNTDRERSWNRRLQAITAYKDPAGASLAASGTAGALYRGAAGTADTAARTNLLNQQMEDQRTSQLSYGLGNIATKAIQAYNSGAAAPPQSTGGYGYGYDGGGAFDYMDQSGNYQPEFRDGGKVEKVMGEFKRGALHSGRGGPVVRDRRQAIAIALSEARRARMADGGEVEDAEIVGGGPIEGPGTGTSDSVKAIKVPGTYILSADTVRALGHEKLRKMMEKAGVRPGEGEDSDGGGAKVRLSNGEWAMPPRVVEHHGEEFFHKMQQKYHKPVHADAGEMANGGPVRAIRQKALPSAVEEAIMRSIPAKAIGR